MGPSGSGSRRSCTAWPPIRHRPSRSPKDRLRGDQDGPLILVAVVSIAAIQKGTDDSALGKGERPINISLTVRCRMHHPSN